MGRRLYHLLTALSLGLCVATVLVRLPSFHVAYAWDVSATSRTMLGLTGQDNHLILTRDTYHTDGDPRRPFKAGLHLEPRGIYCSSGLRSIRPVIYMEQQGATAVPLWPMTLCTLLLPTLQLIRIVNRPPIVGTCARCGYDLRATPDRCPECGRTARVLSE